MPNNETKWDGDLFSLRNPTNNITNYIKGHYLQFKDYINHISSYVPYVPELKQHMFRLKSSYLTAAKDKLSQYGYNNNHSTFVSIHVRLTDYHNALGDLSTISKNYFTRSMGYFHDKYSVSLYLTIFFHGKFSIS